MKRLLLAAAIMVAVLLLPHIFSRAEQEPLVIEVHPGSWQAIDTNPGAWPRGAALERPKVDPIPWLTCTLIYRPLEPGQEQPVEETRA